MTNYLIYFATIALILPAYFMGLFFLFKYFTLELRDIEKKKGLDYPKEKPKEKKDNNKNHLKKLENDIKNLHFLIAEKMESKKEVIEEKEETKEEPKEEDKKEDNDKEENLLEKDEDEDEKRPEKTYKESDAVKLQSFLARMDFIKFRNSLSVENIEAKLNVILQRIVTNFMQTEYYTNKKYINSDGTFNIPNITPSRRERELILLYTRFRKLVSEDVMEELSMIYSKEELDSETFIISNYIAPLYNAEINMLKKRYRAYEQELADAEKATREERLAFEKIESKKSILEETEAYKMREKLLKNEKFVAMMNNQEEELTPDEIQKEKMKEYYRSLLKDNDRFYR